MAKTSITANERLQLIGLLMLAKRHNAALKDIAGAVLEITDERNREGQPDDLGHSYDAVYSDYDADTLLSRLELAVSDQ